MRNDDGSILSRIEFARERARTRSIAGEGPDWPDADQVSLEDALVQLSVEAYENGAKVSVGVLQDGSGIFARISYPLWSDCKLAGKTALTVGKDASSALRKVVQLHQSDSKKVWRTDQFAS